MRKLTTLLLVIAFLSSGCMQKFKEQNEQMMQYKRDLNGDILSKLKATTTVFFYKKDNQFSLDSMQSAISEGWTLTPLIFDDIDNFGKYAGNPSYSYFVIQGIKSTASDQNGRTEYSNIHYFLTLRLFREVTKKGKIITEGLCRVELSPNAKTMGEGLSFGKPKNKILNVYDHGIFFNWNPILLKAELEAVQNNLNNNVLPSLFQTYRENNLSSLIAKDTLYVPECIYNSYNAFTGRDKAKSENIFASYGHKYRICSDSELYDIFQTQKRGRLLFEYVKSSSDKFISVFDLKQKKLVYKAYTPISYNLKAKDIEKIN